MKRTLSPLFIRGLSLAIVMTLCLTLGAQTSTTIPHTLLWRITGKGLTKPSYLYGTMHLNDQRLFQFGDSVYRAIETSDGLAIEVNPDEMAAYMVNKMFDKLESGKKLEDILDPAWFEAHKKELAKRFNKRAEDIRASDVVKEKNKWMSEYIEKGEMPTFMDAWLYNTARRQGKWLGGIEDIGDQADLLDDLVDQTDVNNLLGSDEGMTSSKMRPMVDKMIEVYSAQDLDQLQVIMNVQTSAKEKDALLIHRNIKMARRMDSLSALRTMFFAVGAAHLPGDSGVIDLLRKRGFTVEPVFSHKKLAAKDYTFKEVHLPWITVTGEDSAYSVQMPANPASVRLYGIVEMKFLMDLFNLAGYATSAVVRSDRKENMDTLYNNVSRKMFQGKVIAPTRSLEKDGIHGREYIYYGHLSNIRVQIFMDEKMVYMSVLSSVKKEALTTADADKFFQSYTIHAHPVITSKTMAYTDSVIGVSFMTPTNLVYNEKFSNKNDESWNINCFSGMDRATGAVVFLFSKEMKPAYHIASMQRIYDDYDEIFHRDYDHLQKDSLWIDSLKLVGYRGENIANRGLFVNAIMVVRDGRQIILMVGTDSAGLTLPVLKKVSESFHFIDYLKRPWQQYSSPDQSFSFYGPAPVQPHIPKDDSYKMQWVSYDTTTATSYLIWPDTLGKYTWYSSDSAFWETYASLDTAAQEEIWRKDIVNGDLPGREILTRDKTEPIRHYRRRVLISGDKVYKLICYGSRELMTSPAVNQFFEKFRIPTAAKPSAFTTDKTALLLRDLASGDSATQWKAYRAIDDAPFTRSDAPLLREALFHPYKNLYDTGYDDTFNAALAKELAKLHDAATVDFVRDSYGGLTGEKAYLRNIALYTLAKEQTAYSYEVLDKLLQKGPTTIPIGDDLQAALVDSPELCIRVFPSLIPWVSDTLQGPGIGYIALRLTDSGWISKDSLKAMVGPFIACARALLPAIKTTGTYEDGDLYYLLRLIGKVRTPAATALLRSYLAVKNNFLLDEVTKELLRRQQPVPPAVLLRLAKDLSYRSGLYDELKEQHKTALFPAPYRTAVLLGQGSVYTSAGYGNDDEEVDTVTYLTKRTATYQGKSYMFYLYKVTYIQGDDEGAGKIRLGIAGGFDAGGGVEPKKKLTGIYYDEELDEKQLGAQLKAYLKGFEKEGKE